MLKSRGILFDIENLSIDGSTFSKEDNLGGLCGNTINLLRYPYPKFKEASIKQYYRSCADDKEDLRRLGAGGMELTSAISACCAQSRKAQARGDTICAALGSLAFPKNPGTYFP